jgi:hypothetical protein
MRNYTHINEYLDVLAQDVYEQPEDSGHNQLLKEVMERWEHYFRVIHSVLDVGCGKDFIARPYFDNFGTRYVAIDLGSPYTLLNMDMSFLEFQDNMFDGIFARHVLEHSPMALLTLLEWHRVSRRFLFLVLPNPEHFGYIGQNHYSVMGKQQARWLLRRAGWKIIDSQTVPEEYRFVCVKKPLISSEGWAEVPLPRKVYEADRDDK